MIRPPAAAVVDVNDKIRSLVTPKDTDKHITEEQVQEPKTLARLLQDLLRDVASLARRPCPRRIDFEDIVVNGDGVTVHRLPHGFGGRVRWWVTDCVGSNGKLRKIDADTSNDVLAIVSDTSGTVTVRVEEVGG